MLGVDASSTVRRFLGKSEMKIIGLDAGPKHVALVGGRRGWSTGKHSVVVAVTRDIIPMIHDRQPQGGECLKRMPSFSSGNFLRPSLPVLLTGLQSRSVRCRRAI
jgi:hypothetical protein